MKIISAFLGSFNFADFIGSKKAKMTMTTIVTAFVGLLGVDWPEATRVWISGFLVALIGFVMVAYLLAQGKVDVAEVVEAADVLRKSAENPDAAADAARTEPDPPPAA